MVKVGNIEYTIDVEDLLEILQIELHSAGIFYINKIKKLDRDVMITCPYHKNGQESKPSCGVSKDYIDGETKIHCFSCGKTTNIAQMISYCWGYMDNGEFGRDWLDKHFSKQNIILNRDFNLGLDSTPVKEKINIVSEEELDGYRYIHPYMYKRKLTDELIAKYDIGYDQYMKCITFPIKDINGNCVFVAKRSVEGKMFVLPEGQNKPIYNLDRLKDRKELIICESMLNAITCDLYGHDNAVALLGTGSDYQYDILKTLPIRHYILALDNDIAGRKGVQRFFNAFKRKSCIIDLMEVPKGKDINDLTKEEFDYAYNNLSTLTE